MMIVNTILVITIIVVSVMVEVSIFHIIKILVDYINEGDVKMLQNILMSVTERMGEKNE